MATKGANTGRIVAVIAATLISLACGTNYVYSAWAPQFAERMKLSSTQSNLIGTFGNLGMYASGIPLGILVDSKGARPAVILGALSLIVGYYPIHTAYASGPGSMSVASLCFFSLLTGLGSCSAFSASVKVSALNWPEHRGTATAFPLSAFGLSAFFFSSLSSLVFPNDTSDFLLVLSIGTFTLIFVSFFFLRVIPPQPRYSVIPDHGTRSGSSSSQLHRTKSGESRQSAGRYSHEPGTETDDARPEGDAGDDDAAPKRPSSLKGASEPDDGGMDETSSLMSKSTASGPGDVPFEGQATESKDEHSQHHVDIKGLALFSTFEFWQILALLGLLTGVGLMTINNIGNDAQALWSHYDDSVTPDFIQGRQLMHVSILSVMSFLGRLLSGIGSDVITKKLGMSRYWCLVISSAIFCGAQMCAIRIENPQFLWAISGLTGLGYGFLFGVYPALVVDAFGVNGFSQNWGFMCIAPVVSGNIFNLFYGSVYDHHSTVHDDGQRFCTEGSNCYRAAYWFTFVASLAGLGLSLWSVRCDHVKKNQQIRDADSMREA
ncbi:MAG: hypothetical protein M4579_001683 [Chaenotheca gracillima]|nr:MAG: hypothetical protein M4579_001683 [Chaenotheca gracillima]